MTDHKELCAHLRAGAISAPMLQRTSDLIEQQAARIAELERSPWRPMSECPDDKRLILVMQGDDLLPNPNVQLAIGPTRTAMGMAIAWMPIPKYQE